MCGKRGGRELKNALKRLFCAFCENKEKITKSINIENGNIGMNESRGIKNCFL